MSLFSKIQMLATSVLRPPQSLSLYRNSFSTFTSPLFFRNTQPLCAEPMKKKKKIDPHVARAREERRKKKIEREIRKLRKQALQLKPIDELEVPPELILKKELRSRPPLNLSEEVLEKRKNLIDEWTAYRSKETQKDYKMIDRLMFAQQKALDELRLESEELYQEAIQIDENLIPFHAKGPVRTPPIKDYDVPDGDYVNVTRDFEKEHVERKAALEAILNKSRKPHQRKK